MLGTPSLEDMKHITSPKAIKNLLAQQKPPAPEKLYSIASNISHGAVHLLSQMLVFNPVGWFIASGAILDACIVKLAAV